MTIWQGVFWTFGLTVFFQSQAAAVVYGDRWNYDKTIERKDGFMDFAPEEWENIGCDESTPEGLDACLGYRDKWHTGQGWKVEKNYCVWCPLTLPDKCDNHRMSPINLERVRGLGYWNKTEENNRNPGPGAHPEARECIDEHWMKYEDSSCDLKQLIAANAFTIERHSLRITQPITVLDPKTDELQIDCEFPNGRGRKFGRIDFSRGFSEWWYLSHIDIHTPSEHTQEGKRYDAELQMHHFYSVRKESNQVAAVAIFLQAYDDAQPFRYLDKLICLWRRYEQATRLSCNLPPITDPYPGCFSVPRRFLVRREDQQNKTKPKSPYPTTMDWIMAKGRLEQTPRTNRNANTTKFPTLVMEDVNFEDAEMDDEEWGEFIAQESASFKSEERMWKKLRREFNNTDQAHEAFHQRHLLAGNDLDWFNYFAMLAVRTEYYFRYTGSQTIPPCYGNVEKDSKSRTNHWRVMKDPIRIHPRQVQEMKRLIRERIAPKDDPVMSCQPDTAAKVRPDGTVDTARPLQSTNSAHNDVFCECKDWPSKWPEDREWCRMKNATDRFYDHPYNFKGSEF